MTPFISYETKSNRRTSDPTKYFGIELGAQTHIDTVNERYIVNGSHDEMKMQEILGTWVAKSHFQNLNFFRKFFPTHDKDGYIKKFVLCQSCCNPETKLTVRKAGIIQNCQACGYKGK